MAILKVSRLGHPVLREKASDVEVKDIKAGKFKTLIDDMVETMHAYEGVGLAGPQVHLPLRVFVFEVQDRVAKRRGVKSVGVGAIFNATYEPLGTEQITDWEGCLSVPFLGRIPIYEPIRRGGDTGVPITIGEPKSAAAQAFRAAAERLAAQIAVATFNAGAVKRPIPLTQVR